MMSAGQLHNRYDKKVTSRTLDWTKYSTTNSKPIRDLIRNTISAIMLVQIYLHIDRRVPLTHRLSGLTR